MRGPRPLLSQHASPRVRNRWRLVSDPSPARFRFAGEWSPDRPLEGRFAVCPARSIYRDRGGQTGTLFVTNPPGVPVLFSGAEGVGPPGPGWDGTGGGRAVPWPSDHAAGPPARHRGL
jgi:hypothetical protein